MHSIVIRWGFLVSSPLRYSEPVTLRWAWASTRLCRLAIGRAHAARFSSNGDRLAWGQLNPSPLWLVQGLVSSFCPTEIGLLMLTLWSCCPGPGWCTELTFPGSCPLEWPTWMGVLGQPELWTAVYFTSNDHFAYMRLCAENMWNHLAWFWRERT